MMEFNGKHIAIAIGLVWLSHIHIVTSVTGLPDIETEPPTTTSTTNEVTTTSDQAKTSGPPTKSPTAYCDTIGHWGPHCRKLCNCNKKKRCPQNSGLCPPGGCLAGWVGLRCDKECDDGQWGFGCSEKCYCKDKKPCSKDLGICPGGCDVGWTGPNCNEPERPCEIGLWGTDCSKPCHCNNKKPCDKSNGFCPEGGCLLGWVGLKCDKECDDGQWGFGCSEKCYCKDKKPCSKDLGICPDGCDVGWTGPNCNLREGFSGSGAGERKLNPSLLLIVVASAAILYC